MEIFNVHIFEFLMIAGLALVVFGPERLPEIGRFIGQQVARFLAWQQQSPEIQMLNEVRGEFEREIASLRDELVRTRNQLDIRSDVNAIREELRPMLDLKSGFNREAAGVANGAAPAAADAQVAPSTVDAAATPSAQAAPVAADAPAAPGTVDAPAAVDAPAVETSPAELLDELLEAEPPAAAQPTPTPAAQTVQAKARPDRLSHTEPTNVLNPPAARKDTRAQTLAESRSRLHDAPEIEPAEASRKEDTQGAGQPGEPDGEELLRRLNATAAELQALVSELRGRGLIGGDWQVAAPPEQETMQP